MSNEATQESNGRPDAARRGLGVNWTRLEGVVGLGAIAASFLWFLGMPAAMAIGFGFGIVFLLDVARHSIFVTSKRHRSELGDLDTISD